MNMKARDNIMVALASGDQKSKAMAATALTLGIGNKPGPPLDTTFRTRASNCILVTIVIICVCVLVACGVMIVREYALAKGYHLTTCRVSALKYTDKNMPCTFCGNGSKDKKSDKKAGACVESKFPCLQVLVEFTAKGTSHTGLMHPDSLQADSRYGKSCSYSMCLKTLEENKRAAKKYEDQWRERASEQFDCFYSTSNMEHAILEKMHTKEDVLHSMLWPSLIIVVCGIVFIKMEMKRRGIACCGSNSEDGDEDNVENGKRSRTGSGDPSAEYLLSARNGGVPGTSEKKTLLRYTPGPTSGKTMINKAPPPSIECSLAPNTYLDKNCSSFISSSLSSLDRLAKTVDRSKLSASNGRVMSVISADGIRPGVREPPDGRPSSASCSPSHRPKSSLAGATFSPYADSHCGGGGDGGSHHGSKIMGLETPV